MAVTNIMAGKRKNKKKKENPLEKFAYNEASAIHSNVRNSAINVYLGSGKWSRTNRKKAITAD